VMIMYNRSAIPYVGNKFSIYKQLEKYLPSDIKIFRDIFCGGGVVSINTRAEGYVLTDFCHQLVDLHNAIKDETFAKRVLSKSYEYPETKDSYLELRQSYNEDKSNEKFINLLYRSFSNQMRFNTEGEFNIAFGQRNSINFDRLIKQHQFYKDNKVTIINSDFRISLANVNKDDFVFLDPPYLNSDATYNEVWSEHDEMDLYRLVSNLDCKWMLTNTLYNRGKYNKFLDDFIEPYNVYPINSTFNYEKFRKSESAKKEIIVTNYDHVENFLI